MKARRYARVTTRGSGRDDRRNGTVVKGRPPEGPSIIQQRKAAADEPVPEGYARCSECGRVIGLRASDGEIRAHRSQDKIPCIGARASFGTDEFGNTRYL